MNGAPCAHAGYPVDEDQVAADLTGMASPTDQAAPSEAPLASVPPDACEAPSAPFAGGQRLSFADPALIQTRWGALRIRLDTPAAGSLSPVNVIL